jgi:hypothetical protein
MSKQRMHMLEWFIGVVIVVVIASALYVLTGGKL